MTRSLLIKVLVVGAILWWLMGDAHATKTPTASVELGEGVILSSDPFAQGDNDYLVRPAGQLSSAWIPDCSAEGKIC